MSSTVVQVVRTREFDRKATKLWDEGELAELIRTLARRPDSGVHLGEGLYKVRVGIAGRGKRGGGRVIYLWLSAKATIYLLSAYAKNEKDNLSAAELKALRNFVKKLRGQ